jgi:hypothetical protein
MNISQFEVSINREKFLKYVEKRITPFVPRYGYFDYEIDISDVNEDIVILDYYSKRSFRNKGHIGLYRNSGQLKISTKNEKITVLSVSNSDHQQINIDPELLTLIRDILFYYFGSAFIDDLKDELQNPTINDNFMINTQALSTFIKQNTRYHTPYYYLDGGLDKEGTMLISQKYYGESMATVFKIDLTEDNESIIVIHTPGPHILKDRNILLIKRALFKYFPYSEDIKQPSE